jgi:hypothetical protein
VAIVVTQKGDSKVPLLSALDIPVVEVKSCCSAVGNFGFSRNAIQHGPVFGGIADADPSLCLASGGDLLFEGAVGSPGSAQVWTNITSQITEGGGIQGWSFGVAVDGPVAILSSTTDGTIVQGVGLAGGFDVTEVVDPAKQSPPGQNGIVSAVVIHLKKGTTLPLMETNSVVQINLQGQAPIGDEDQIAIVRLRGGLRGSGEPVPNVLTIGGDSAEACNEDFASARVIIRKSSVASFIRGDVNPQPGLDIGDPIWIINELFRSGPPSPCRAAGDANDDGLYDASDAVYLIDYLFKAGPPPLPPFEVCGPDPTPDSLPCESRC